MSEDSLKKKTISGLFWIFAERLGARMVGFVVSIILARLLIPEAYGVIAIVQVFINLCDVFVERGFGKSLIQKKDADELDFSSVFYFSLALAVVLYGVLFAAAPYIAAFYEMEIICPVIRVMGLRLPISSFKIVQKSRASKAMQFRRFFYATLSGTLVSAAVGIAMAYFGFGVWALVAQDLVNLIINTLILFVMIRWRPRLMFSWARMRGLFQYGWKVLAASLIETLYEDFKSLYVGKVHTATDLAYYSRGKQFPYLIVDNINSSINSVLFPAIASQQGDKETVRAMSRRAMKTSAYVMSPMFFGLAAVAEPLVLLVLTEKWLPCVPYVQILCINCALTPLQTANTQAVYALGRSDLVLKMNIIKRTFGILMVVIFARISVLAMAWSGVVTGFVCLMLNAYPNKKLLDYGILEQMKDVVPCWLMSGAMMLLVMAVSLLGLPMIPELVLMILVGVVSYVAMSVIFRVESFTYILDTVRPALAKLKKK